MMSVLENSTVALQGNLSLYDLSSKSFPEIVFFETIKTVDLQHLEEIDSAGVAYLTQIKSRYTDIAFTGVSEKVLILANLYGVSFLFN